MQRLRGNLFVAIVGKTKLRLSEIRKFAQVHGVTKRQNKV